MVRRSVKIIQDDCVHQKRSKSNEKKILECSNCKTPALSTATSTAVEDGLTALKLRPICVFWQFLNCSNV